MLTQDFFTCIRYACNSFRDPGVPGQQLMAAFVGDHGFE